MAYARLIFLTSLAMLAFAGNSLLCRLALTGTAIDAVSFTAIRLAAGAAALCLIVLVRRRKLPGKGSWPSACALLAYAACFSWAYTQLSAATGALLLFAAVQATMIGYGIRKGEPLSRMQIAGLMLAGGGLVALLLPGLASPPMAGALLMLSAGAAWGIYSLRGKGAGDPTQVTAGNFMRAALAAAGLVLAAIPLGRASVDMAGLGYAVLSGAVTSGLGYVVWYSVLPSLRAVSAASVQLSVPALAALGGAMLLGETITLRLLLSSAAILGGIALVILQQYASRPN
ncbi:DMT family transporter [Massilia sp. BJB1822]|uniref:DMT family transporter n=1 Tax=Massilia sp. BJB1822 TaxID=2744470 RepID=UPI00159327C6|nr:DMT family transporter [Massilia sp. BJB1822]NVE00068.1 DMT family transporter [Massilia sp. BJB1822]